MNYLRVRKIQVSEGRKDCCRLRVSMEKEEVSAR